MLVHSCAVAGASMNYFLSMKLGSGLMESKFPGKLAWFQQKIEENKKDLFFYILSLRLAPVVPNVIMNMASGCVGVPFRIFLLASIIGQIPFTFLYIKTGNMLDKITSGGVLDFYVSALIITNNHGDKAPLLFSQLLEVFLLLPTALSVPTDGRSNPT